MEKMNFVEKMNLMEKLFYENELLFHPNIMIKYKIWVKNEKPNGNTYQRMKKFIDTHLELYRSRNEVINEEN